MTLSTDLLPFSPVIALILFARIGAVFMTAPALGDFSLIPRIRLVAALLVTLALFPIAAPVYETAMAARPDHAIAALLIAETVIGLFIGLLARILFSALNVAGQIIAFQMGLSLAQVFDPTQQLQGALIGGFLAVMGTAVIFSADLHYLFLFALRDSYAVFIPGSALALGDMAAAMTDVMASAFTLGTRLAAPFIVFGLVFYTAAGVLNRLIPQVQVFFMLLPANLGLGLVLLMLTVGTIVTLFLGELERVYDPILGGVR